MTDPLRPDDGPPHPQVVSADRAKQGRRGLHILVVLIISAALAALAMFAIWMTRTGDLREAEATEINAPAEASGVDQPVDDAREEASPQETPGQ